MNNSQKMKIYEHLMDGNTITQEEAITLCRCFRLSAVIERLRKAGNNVITIREPNRDGAGYHARYKLLPEDKEA